MYKNNNIKKGKHIDVLSFIFYEDSMNGLICVLVQESRIESDKNQNDSYICNKPLPKMISEK